MQVEKIGLHVEIGLQGGIALEQNVVELENDVTAMLS